MRLDRPDETHVIVETRDYQDFDHGYATTVHKAQGSTVNRAYVLAGRYFDRHTSYVALSRNRQSARLYFAQEEFAAGTQGGVIDALAAREKFLPTLSRARQKELAHDYLDRDLSEDAARALGAGHEKDSYSPARSLTAEELQARTRALAKLSRAQRSGQGGWGGS